MEQTISEGILEIVNRRSPRAWLMIDTNYYVVYVNDAFCKIWNCRREELIGTSVFGRIHGTAQRNASGEYQGPLVETMETGREFRETEVHIRNALTQRHYWFLANTYLLRDKEGKPKYAAGNYVEIDKFKAIEHRLNDINVSIIKAFARAIGTRDAYTMQHEEHVAALMVGLAEYMNMSADDVSTAYLAGLVHDVGKLGISEQVLNKPSRLTIEEYSMIKLHSAMGADILCEIDGFKDIAAIVRFHHERFDGAGYPAGISGAGIPVFSRMLAICDAYDAMTTLRCYRQPITVEEALSEIKHCSGTQFDPVISEKFAAYIRESGSKQLCC